MALLWGVAYGWQQDARVQQAQQIGEAGAQLHRRLGTLVGHLDKLGSALTRAINTYNDLVGSLEGRVLPQARKLEDLGILASGTRLPEPHTVDAHARPVSAERYPKVPELETEYEPIGRSLPKRPWKRIERVLGVPAGPPAGQQRRPAGHGLPA
jgi:DNA anti-recombination protein RmuC